VPGFALFLRSLLANTIGSKKQANSASSKDTKLVIKEAVHSLLRGIDYASPADAEEAHKTTLEIVEILRSDYHMYPGRNPAWFESTTLHGAAMGDKSDEPVLQSFCDLFPEIYRLWENISANGIISSAIEFVNGCVLEDIQAVRELRVSPNAQSWPYYLREKTGCASAFSYFIFPQDLSYDVSDYIQVVGDIMIFINLSNDVLSPHVSFYKEEIVGETRNYVHNRSKVYGKTAADTLGDVLCDAVAAYRHMTNILKTWSPTCCESWRSFASGYMYVQPGNLYDLVTDIVL
ncbi:hypothetical protein H0H92_002396, partial [Tricholoma furcatifolium]